MKAVLFAFIALLGNAPEYSSELCTGGGCKERVCIVPQGPDESEQALEDSTPKDDD